jgi:hypothetical protein
MLEIQFLFIADNAHHKSLQASRNIVHASDLTIPNNILVDGDNNTNYSF